MRLFGEGLYSDGQHILKNKRYIKSDFQVYIESAVPEEYSYNIFGYDLFCGFLKIHIIDINRVYPYKDWHVEEHYHDFYELHIIPRGHGRIILDGVTFEVAPEQFYLTGPYVTHEQISDPKDPMEEYCIQFSIKISDTVSSSGYQSELEAYRAILGASYPIAFPDHLQLYKTFERMMEEVEQAQIAYELSVNMLVTEILTNTMRTVQSAIRTTPKRSEHTPESERRMSVIRHFVEANYAEKISIHDASNLLFLSVKQVNRILLRAYGITFQTYLQKYRCQKAKELIAHTNLPLSEIALRTGLSSESHLHKLFKKFDFATPGSYRL